MKKMTRVILMVVLIAAVVVGGVFAYRYYLQPPPIKPLNVTVKIGQFPISMDHIARDYANTVILPQKYGVTVTPVYFSSGKPMVAALISGDVDIIGVALTEADNAMTQGAKFKVFALEDAAPPYLLVAKGSITSLKDLATNGGSVGVSSIGGLTYVLAYIGLKLSGVDVSKIQWIPVGSGKERAQALAAGKVDAAPIVYDDLAQMPQGYHEIADLGKIIGSYVDTPLTTREDYVSAHPDVLQAVTSAYIEANRWALKSQDDFVKFASTVMPLENATIISNAYPKMVASGIWNPNGGLTKAVWDKTLNFLFDAKLITTKIPFEQGAAIQFQDQALARLGTVQAISGPLLGSPSNLEFYIPDLKAGTN